VGTVDNELVLVLVLDQTSADELLHHVCGQLTSLGFLLQLEDLQSESLNLLTLIVLFDLLLQLCLLVSLDLGHSAAALARDLQHVRGHAFGH